MAHAFLRRYYPDQVHGSGLCGSLSQPTNLGPPSCAASLAKRRPHGKLSRDQARRPAACRALAGGRILAPMLSMDLNADLGESFGAWALGQDEALFRFISSANVACGFHAGDPAVMERTVRLAAAAGVAVGAHPGYPDLAGFGRRSMALSEDEVYGVVLYQIGAIRAFATAAGTELRHVKPHGALYNDAARDAAKARGIIRAVKAAGGALTLVGLPMSLLEELADEAGIAYAREFFADRAYEDDGSLVSRSAPGAVLHDPVMVLERALKAVESGCVSSITGLAIKLSFDTICLHGDSPEALCFAQVLAKALADRGIAVAAPARP